MTAEDEEVRIITDRIRRAEQIVASDLVKERRFYSRVVADNGRELIGYERDLVAAPLTEFEGRMILSSSLATASNSILHLLYQGRYGLDVLRMRALISIVERVGVHEFAREREVHRALQQGHWRKAANLVIDLLVRYRIPTKVATTLADWIRQGQTKDEGEV